MGCGWGPALLLRVAATPPPRRPDPPQNVCNLAHRPTPRPGVWSRQLAPCTGAGARSSSPSRPRHFLVIRRGLVNRPVRRGLTLLQLLVVLAIIAVLIRL